MSGATRLMTLLTAPVPPLRPSLLLRRRISTVIHHRTLNPSSHFKPKSQARRFINSSFHSPTNNNNNNNNNNNSSYAALHSSSQHQLQQHPWPEWTNFINILSNGQLGLFEQRILPEDAFVLYEELPDEFVRVAASCLDFARSRPDILGLLSKRNIEAVVSNGTPFLFKSALDTVKRMRSFLGADGGSVSEFDKATTVDLMKYIISYASNPIVSSEKSGLYSRELVDSSVRNLLSELSAMSHGSQNGYAPAAENCFSGRYGQTPRPLGQNIEMKRGDWICTKCSFMNFARNMKCLECEESRPKKELIGGEWECPQCTFFNYGRNSVCLRCDCRRPGSPLFNPTNSTSSQGYNRDYTFKANSSTGRNLNQILSRSSTVSERDETHITADSSPPFPQSGRPSNYQDSFERNSNNAPFAPSNPGTYSRNDQMSETPTTEIQQTVKPENVISTETRGQSANPESWFKKLSELHEGENSQTTISDDDFPEIMPMRKGENRFVVSKKKDRSLTSPQYKRQVAMDQENNTNFVPFVPFPPDYFAKKDTEKPEKISTDRNSENNSQILDVNHTIPPSDSTHVQNPVTSRGIKSNTWTEGYSGNVANRQEDSQILNNSDMLPPDSAPVENPTSSRPSKNNSWSEGYSGNVAGSWTGKSLEGSAVKETDPLDMSEEAKAERWFKRVAQIKDISELSQIPDEDFPSIMPMRKGVNRFVVSKRKTPLERRLTSQQYRRNLPIVSTDSVKKENDDN